VEPATPGEVTSACIVQALQVRAEVLIDVRAALGEGPRWDAARQRLLWVDIEGRALHAWDGSRDRALPVGARVGAAAPTAGAGVLVALADRLALVGESGALRDLVALPHGAEHRLNDGVCDDQGRFWVGSMRIDEAPGEAALYRYDGVDLVTILTGVSLSNGIGWSPDRTRMYYVDSPTQRIDVFDYDGEARNRRPFATIDDGDGTPDGLAVDDEGGVWLSLWGGSSVRRYDPSGRLDATVEVAAERVTASCFGGDDGRTMFITTAAPDGRVYVCEPGVSGPAAAPFCSTAPSDAEPTSAR
jgi:sugar lactone lactonase YvrE